MRDIEAQLHRGLFEREEAAHVITVGLLASEHVLLVGVGGGAKTDMAERLATLVDGARFSGHALSERSDLEALFGPFAMSLLEHDIYARQLEGTAADAEFVFVDEVGNASAGLLKGLHQLMQERRVENPTPIWDSEGYLVGVDRSWHQTPLRLMIGTTNTLPPAGGGLDAFMDRWVLKLQVGPIDSDDNFEAALMASAEGIRPVLTPVATLDELDAACAAVRKVKFGPDTARVMASLRARLTTQGVWASDRRWMKAVRILQAEAFLAGADAVGPEHLDVLRHVLWNQTEQCQAVANEIHRIDSVDDIEAAQLLGWLERLSGTVALARNKVWDSVGERQTWLNDAKGQLHQAERSMKPLRRLPGPPASVIRCDGLLSRITDQLKTI